MADNITVKDALGNDVVIAYKDIESVLVQKNILHDGNGQELTTTNRALDVSIQDHYASAVEVFMAETVKALSLHDSSVIALTTKIFKVNSTSGVVAGELFVMQEDGYHYEGIITNVNTGDGEITCDREANYPYTVAAEVYHAKIDIASDGSSVEKVFRISPPAGKQWDITKVAMVIKAAKAMDDSYFGDLTPLTNGCILRAHYDIDGGVPTRADNYGNYKSNADISLSFNSTQYDDRASGAGLYGFMAVKTWNGQEFSGVVIRLDGDSGDNLQFVVRDDLRAITSIRIVAHGHEVIG